MHRFSLIETRISCISILSDAYDCFTRFGPLGDLRRDRVRRGDDGSRREDACRSGWRNRLHRTGAAPAALPASGRHHHAGDVFGRNGGAAAAGARASLERHDHAARRGRARPRRRRGVSWRCPTRRRRSSPRGSSTPACARSISRVRSACATTRCAHAGIRRRTRSRRTWCTGSPSIIGGVSQPLAWLRIRAATQPHRCWRSCRSKRPGSSRRTATSSSTRSPACREPEKRRESTRTSRKCTAACRHTACSRIGTAPRSKRASGERSRSPRISSRSTAGFSRRFTSACHPARLRRRWATRSNQRTPANRSCDSLALSCRKSSTSPTPISATSAGASTRPDGRFSISVIDNLLKGASGQAVQNMNVMLGEPETAGLL